MGDAPPTAPSQAPAEAVTDALRPLQLVLAVGAVLVVSGGAALAAAYGGWPVRALLLVLGAAAAALSLRAAHTRLRSSAETFAACGVGLLVTGTVTGSFGG